MLDRLRHERGREVKEIIIKELYLSDEYIQRQSKIYCKLKSANIVQQLSKNFEHFLYYQIMSEAEKENT